MWIKIIKVIKDSEIMIIYENIISPFRKLNTLYLIIYGCFENFYKKD